MMSTASVTSELGSRLGRLGESDAECLCSISSYRELSGQVRLNRAFALNLARAQAMADESRLTILAMLRRTTELCACELQAALGVTHATVSHHMHQLERAGLIRSSRRGKWVYYRLATRNGVNVP